MTKSTGLDKSATKSANKLVLGQSSKVESKYSLLTSLGQILTFTKNLEFDLPFYTKDKSKSAVFQICHINHDYVCDGSVLKDKFNKNFIEGQLIRKSCNFSELIVSMFFYTIGKDLWIENIYIHKYSLENNDTENNNKHSFIHLLTDYEIKLSPVSITETLSYALQKIRKAHESNCNLALRNCSKAKFLSLTYDLLHYLLYDYKNMYVENPALIAHLHKKRVSFYCFNKQTAKFVLVEKSF